MITQWSYSRFSDYQKCPRRAKFKYVDKYKEPSNDALVKGLTVHKEAEEYLISKEAEIPRSLFRIGKPLAQIKELSALPEMELAFDVNWEPVGWFDSNVWLRVKMDAVVLLRDGKPNFGEPEEVRIIDFKTGKDRDYSEQLNVYAVAALAFWSSCKVASAEIWNTDSSKITKLSVPRAEFLDRRKKIEDSVVKMLSDTDFPPEPGRHCDWCYFIGKCEAMSEKAEEAGC